MKPSLLFWIMATSAFKSTTPRSSIGTPSSSGNSSSSAHRRSRSLSRFSRRPPPTEEEEEEEREEAPVPKGRFVNTVRGSGFPEISLDDLAVELFGSADRGRTSDVSRSVVAGPSQRRGRSVSRRGADGTATTSGSSGVGRAAPDSNSRRRRSVSVVRQQISDSEVKICIQSPLFASNIRKLLFFEEDCSIIASLIGCMV